MINNITLNYFCTGCGACVSICPVNALILQQDDDGFYKPKIDENACVNCGKCLKLCPCNGVQSKNTKTPECFAFNGKDEVQRKSATAGGFQVIAEHFIKKGGKVVGAAWTKDHSVKHIIVDNLNDLSKLYKSKYLQSNMSNIYDEVKTELDKGRI